jgi:hypothetical protein
MTNAQSDNQSICTNALPQAVQKRTHYGSRASGALDSPRSSGVGVTYALARLKNAKCQVPSAKCIGARVRWLTNEVARSRHWIRWSRWLIIRHVTSRKITAKTQRREGASGESMAHDHSFDAVSYDRDVEVDQEPESPSRKSQVTH